MRWETSGCSIEAGKKPELNYQLWSIWPGTHNMVFRRILMTALMTAARNPAVQKKAGEAAGKALHAARPGLLAASRKAGEITRKISKNMKKN